MKNYLINVGSEVVGWFVGAAIVVLAASQSTDLTNPLVWKTAALAGVAGVVKGLASRFTGDPNSGSLRS